jgi:Protein of unknown function with PCYCGC motif
MNSMQKLFAAASLLAAGAAVLAVPQFAASQTQQMQGMQHDASDEATPAFHPQAPQDKLPDTLEPSLFNEKLIFNAYAVAGRVEKVLYQQPCYCHCDRSQGHGSLLDCFVSHHGSGCEVCQKEAFFSYEQTRKGKTPTQIREAIMRGDWQKVDLTKYQAAYLPPASK